MTATARASLPTFDYEAAWHEVARPAYESLPANVRDLLAQVATEAADLSQLPDLSMPWPTTDLRERFAAVPAEWLAQAARVIYNAGHWYPATGKLDIPGRLHGASWKFSHYADQDLRRRLIAATSADTMRNNGPFQVHEGAIRFCYSSPDSWTWEEVAPATVEGLERAQALAHELSEARAQVIGKSHTAYELREQITWKWFHDLKARDLGWPAAWAPFMNTAAYMRPEQEIRLRRLAAITPEEHAAKRAKKRNAIIERFEHAARKALNQRAADLWVHDADLDTDNAIFYDHDNDGAGLICFGWRELVTDAVRDQILAVISECPFAYRIKCADGRTLEGGIG